jgi:hypothetical protein
MAGSIACTMSEVCNLFEVESERHYFWAVAFIEVDADLDLLWQEFECESLMFEEIHQIVDDFNNFTEWEFDEEELELFVAQKIWQDKRDRDRICNPEFKAHLVWMGARSSIVKTIATTAGRASLDEHLLN